MGEYSALSCAGYLNFVETIKILNLRGEAMQNAVPYGEGGMLAVLGSTIEEIENVLIKNLNVLINYLINIFSLFKLFIDLIAS